MKKIVSGIMLTVLLIGMSALAFNIQPVKATGGTIYIRADGSIHPPDAPIITYDNITYTFTADIYDSIVVQRDNIVVEGAGYTVQGTGREIGIDLAGRSNVTIKNVKVTNSYYGIYLHYGSKNNVLFGNNASNNQCGIWLYYSSKNALSGNNASNNGKGILLESSSNNALSGNTASNNGKGIRLYYSSNNTLFHNNFIDNTNQVCSEDSINTWDGGYPSGGNYWSDYAGVDADGDGIADTPYTIDADNTDRYPLTGPISVFDAGTWNGVAYNVDIASNSTVSGFYFNPEGAFLRFNITGQDGTVGFCRVTIPKSLLWVEDGWTVYVDGQPTDYKIIPDENYTYLYFTYNHTTKTVIIQGTHAILEFPLTIILPLFTLTTLIATILLKKKRKTKPQIP